MGKNLLSIIALLALCFTTVFSQNGTIRGSVLEEATGEGLIGVTVVIDGTTKGTITDFDGHFSISAEPGTYAIKASFISYQTIRIENVVVKPNEVTLLNNIIMKSDDEELSEVVVTAKRIETSEAAVMTIKRKSIEILDGISAEQIQMTGDGTAVEAAKRVTGVSVEGGKYVYIRGLGDRYSKTTFNGMDIPGLDPDRNTLQLDIFPTNLIGNLMVSKNFTADKSADFTGGLLDIETKDFPDQRIISFSLDVGYNPNMHFKKDYLSYQTSKTDFLGFDNGSRALPSEVQAIENSKGRFPYPNVNPNDEVFKLSNSFNKDLGVDKKMSILDFSGSFTIGNQYDIKKDSETGSSNKKLGYIFSLSYKSDYKYYDDVTYGEYQRLADPNEKELIDVNIFKGAYGERTFLLGGLAGLAYKNRTSKYRFTVLRLQSGTSRAGQFSLYNNGDAGVGASGYTGISDNLEYNERSLTNFMLGGEHSIKENKWEMKWGLSPTLSTSKDPDIRSTAFTNKNDELLFSAGDAGFPTRIWRSLNEYNVPVKLDITNNYTLFKRDAKVKFGASHVYKNRNYEILTYNLSSNTTLNNQSWTGDPDDVLNEENLFPNGTNQMYFESGNSRPNANQYSANSNTTGFYASTEVSPAKKLKTVIGLRMEYFALRHTGRDISQTNVLDNKKVLSSFDFFPTANLIYAITEKQNLRISYARTIARPSFKEMSYASIVDPFTSRIFDGGMFAIGDWDGNLHETYINNVDLRWEYFMNKGQVLSLSGFFKHFKDPIELVRIPEQQTTIEYQPRNVGTGMLFGLEAEFRKNLGFITPALDNLYINGNITGVYSVIDMTDTEYNARKTRERTGETIDKKRVMAGQAPYVINAGISYFNHELGLDVGLFYNVKGKTLFLVGNGLNPDVYVTPFHNLNFKASQLFGKEKRWKCSVSIDNIIGDDRLWQYESFEATPQIYEQRKPGRLFSVGFSYTLK
ncbi:MAG: TonB-dependent receptor [Bacteroidetes bacterium]|nr:TonB-dependent receptor [Bacteroidota bacterium]